MSNKGFGSQLDGCLWWDAGRQRKTKIAGYAAARDAFQTNRYFLSGKRSQRQDPAAGPLALLREFCRHWQSRWVQAYTSHPEVGPIAKAAIRKRQGSAFEARNVAMIHRRVGERLACLPVARNFDLNGDFARPLSFLLAAELLGVTLQPDLCHQAAGIGVVQIAQELAPEDKLPAYRALQSLHRALHGCVESGALEPDGLMRRFLDIEAEHGLDRDFSLMSAANFLAGSVTLGTAMALCLDRITTSDHLTLLAQTGDDMLPAIVDEILRLYPPARNIRLMTQATETAEPELLFFSVARANTDPAAFPKPDQMAFDRVGPPHLSFGSGAHICDGVRLVRLTLKVALPTILNRMHGLEVRETGPMEFTARFDRLASPPAQ
ncbi:cytochrome P450 [Constrictibacter sp. MBR-5]|jgi:cytochrome P450|uniref:cytochrome P450 n=1 Tax=Constrictibacter sp. MBR-5 TaxID=3156467 RepID=UPI0033980FFA